MTKITTIKIDAGNALNALHEVIQKPLVILNASIQEGKCNYGYEIKTGPTAGDKITGRKGSAYCHEAMDKAFIAMNVHLAIIDDAFLHVEVNDLESMRGNELTGKFHVNEFKVTGKEENEGFIITGEKWVSTGSISLTSPKITKTSNYPFFDDLQECIEAARIEVEAYNSGTSANKIEQGAFDFGMKHEGNEFDNPIE